MRLQSCVGILALMRSVRRFVEFQFVKLTKPPVRALPEFPLATLATLATFTHIHAVGKDCIMHVMQMDQIFKLIQPCGPSTKLGRFLRPWWTQPFWNGRQLSEPLRMQLLNTRRADTLSVCSSPIMIRSSNIIYAAIHVLECSCSMRAQESG